MKKAEVNASISYEVLIGSGLSACTPQELEQFRTILLPYIPDTFLRGVD